MAQHDGIDHGTGRPQDQAPLVAEHMYLSWWRTSLATLAVALGIGKVLPDLLDSGTAWPYLVVGVAWGLLAVALAVYGLVRQRELHKAIDADVIVSSHPLVVNVMAITGILLIIASAALVFVRP